jgi:hypothetical protein
MLVRTAQGGGHALARFMGQANALLASWCIGKSPEPAPESTLSD